jgi:hypothetical protein
MLDYYCLPALSVQGLNRYGRGSAVDNDLIYKKTNEPGGKAVKTRIGVLVGVQIMDSDHHAGTVKSDQQQARSKGERPEEEPWGIATLIVRSHPVPMHDLIPSNPVQSSKGIGVVHRRAPDGIDSDVGK